MVRQAIDAERYLCLYGTGSELKCRPWQRSSRNIRSSWPHGVGDSFLAPQLMAELGDVTRFTQTPLLRVLTWR